MSITRQTAIAAGLPEINRRTILGGLAATTALVATNHARADGPPDAELIRLGKEFDRLRDEYYPLRDEVHRLHHVWIDACKQCGILLASDAANGWPIAEEVGYAEAERREEPIQMALDATVSAILAAPAATVAGLAVKAKVLRSEVLALAVEPTEAEYRDMDWGDETVTRFYFEIERMAGGAS